MMSAAADVSPVLNMSNAAREICSFCWLPIWAPLLVGCRPTLTGQRCPNQVAARADGSGRHRQRRAGDRRGGRFEMPARGLVHERARRRDGDEAACGVVERLGRGRVRIGEDEGPTLVGARSQLLLEWDLAEERDVELVGEQLAAALAEDREALSARSGEAGHVLDHAGDLELEAL